MSTEYQRGYYEGMAEAARMTCVQCGVGSPLNADGDWHLNRPDGDILLPEGRCQAQHIWRMHARLVIETEGSEDYDRIRRFVNGP